MDSQTNCVFFFLQVDKSEEKLSELLSTDKSSGHNVDKHQQEPGMHATAIVPPFLNYSMRSHTQEHSNTTSTAEGSFAAALRKLAQQAPGFPSPLTRERRPTSPPPKNGAGMLLNTVIICIHVSI